MPILVPITSGRGPVECCWVVARLAEAMLADARKLGLHIFRPGCSYRNHEEERSPAVSMLMTKEDVCSKVNTGRWSVT